MKIPFTLDAWLKDKSQKVENKYGKEVHLLEYDLRPANSKRIIGYEERGGENLRYAESDLFIVTPEEELTPFEKELVEILKCLSGRPSEQTYEDYAKEQTAALLAKALRTRATELTENLVKSGLDKDSIPYHLIEFMCNLYTCQNWKEIEETAELYVSRIKAAAMKDLPRWTDDGSPKGSALIDINGLCGFDFIRRHGKLLRISDLEKLPGFKED